MNLINYPKNKVLALTPACAKRTCGIALSAIILNPVFATAEVVNSTSPVVSEVVPMAIFSGPESISLEATATNTGDSASPEVSPIDISTSSEIIPLEIVSKNASDLIVEVSDSPTTSPSEITPNSGETGGDVPIEDTPSETPELKDAPSNSSQSLGERSRLTGDWGGVRSQWEDKGVTLNLEFTQFYQGLVSGTGDQTFEYGGRVDGFADFDFEKLGLWKGGGFHSHLEYRFGNLAGDLGGAFFPTNSGMEFPGESPDTLVATSLYLSQRFGDRGSLLIGKINALDLLENDPFFGGWGIHKFQNTVFVAPPSGLVPPVFFGAIANVKLDPVTVSLWIYDPDDRTQDYWPNDLFANGVTFYLQTTYATEIAGRPTSFSLIGIYSTKTGTDFSSVSEAFRSGTEPLTKTGTYSIGFQFSHLFHQNPSNPKDGWGLFLKGSISDGNPNYVQNSIYGGIGGTGLFRGRELDSFGLGYFYYDLSDDLQYSLNDLTKRVSVGDEQGIEVYYSYAVTPWFYLTADLQYINPPLSSFENAFIAGLRANIRF